MKLKKQQSLCQKIPTNLKREEQYALLIQWSITKYFK